MAGNQDRPDSWLKLIRDILGKRYLTLHAALLMFCAAVAIAIATAGPALAVLLVFGNPNAAAVVGVLSTISAGVVARRATQARRQVEEAQSEE